MFWKKKKDYFKLIVRSHDDIPQEARGWKFTGITFWHTKPLTSLTFYSWDY